MMCVALSSRYVSSRSPLRLRFTEGTFNPDLAVTVGLDFKVFLHLRNASIPLFKYIIIHLQIHLLDAHSQLKIRLNIWDTAGQEKFHSLTGSYYRGAHGIFIVYSVAERASFDSLRSTLQEVDQHITKRNVVKVLVGNKIDLPGRQVSEEEGREFARAHGLYFLECSCKDDIHVNDAFVCFSVFYLHLYLMFLRKLSSMLCSIVPLF